MNSFLEAAQQATSILEGLERRYALVGGLAVSVRCEPRFTRDLDLVVAVDDDERAEKTVRAFLDSSYEVRLVVEHETSGRLATVRLRSADGHLVDLLFASSGIEAEVASDADVLEVVPTLHLPVATLAHLIVLKLLARDDTARPQDLGDLRALVATADESTIADARHAIALVTERGYQRGRDLDAALDQLLV